MLLWKLLSQVNPSASLKTGAHTGAAIRASLKTILLFGVNGDLDCRVRHRLPRNDVEKRGAVPPEKALRPA